MVYAFYLLFFSSTTIAHTLCVRDANLRTFIVLCSLVCFSCTIGLGIPSPSHQLGKLYSFLVSPAWDLLTSAAPVSLWPFSPAKSTLRSLRVCLLLDSHRYVQRFKTLVPVHWFKTLDSLHWQDTGFKTLVSTLVSRPWIQDTGFKTLDTRHCFPPFLSPCVCGSASLWMGGFGALVTCPK